MSKIQGEINRKIVHSLLELQRRKGDFNANFYISIYKKYERFSPKQLLEIFELFSEFDIPFRKQYFKATLSKSKFRYEFYQMDTAKQHAIWECMSKDQQAFIRVVNALTLLGTKNPEFDAISYIKYYIKVFAFTPKMLSYVLYLLGKYDITHQISDFKIFIMRHSDRAQLGELEEWKIKKMWPALSYSQKEIYNNEFAERKIASDYKPT